MYFKTNTLVAKSETKQEGIILKIGLGGFVFSKDYPPEPACAGDVKHRINFRQPYSQKEGPKLCLNYPPHDPEIPLSTRVLQRAVLCQTHSPHDPGNRSGSL